MPLLPNRTVNPAAAAPSAAMAARARNLAIFRFWSVFRSALVLSGVLFFAVGVSGEACAGLPANHDVQRFEPIWKRSPFVAVSNVAASEGIAGRFAVTGFAKLGQSDIVFVFDRKELRRFAIAKEAPVDGLELLSVAEGGRPEDFKARIRSGGESADICFDASLAASAEPPGEKRAPAAASRAAGSGMQAEAPVAGAAGNPVLAAGSNPPQVPRATRVIRRRTISAQ